MVVIPAPDDLFFSLLFHAKVHKPEVKASYFDKLLDLSRLIKADWFSREIIESDGLASDIIGGYMRSCQYYLESPVDKNVYINKKIAEKLPKIQQHKGLRYFDPAARLLRKWRKSLLRERT